MAKGKRRPKGSGSISVLPDGRADAEFKIRQWDGSIRRERKRLSSEDEAERWLLRVRHEHQEGTLLSQQAGRLTLGEYLNAWLRDSVVGTVARHTQRDYEDKVRLHIGPALGRIRLADLTTQHLNRFYRQKLGEGQSPRSVRYMHTTLSKALHEAEGADLVRKNVARWAKPPKDEHVEKPVLSVAEAMLFLEAIRGGLHGSSLPAGRHHGLEAWRDARSQVGGSRPCEGHSARL
jgi:integrase